MMSGMDEGHHPESCGFHVPSRPLKSLIESRPPQHHHQALQTKPDRTLRKLCPACCTLAVLQPLSSRGREVHRSFLTRGCPSPFDVPPDSPPAAPSLPKPPPSRP